MKSIYAGLILFMVLTAFDYCLNRQYIRLGPVFRAMTTGMMALIVFSLVFYYF